MATPISMPKLGMTMEEGTVVRWEFDVGAHVEKGDVVLVIESEKNEADIEAAASGTFRHVYIEEGDTVPCGTLLGAITESPDEAFDASAFQAAEDHPETQAGGSLEVRTPTRQTPPSPAERQTKPIAPAARAAAKKLGLDPTQIRGTGPGGRVTKQDVEAHASAREALTPVANGVALEVVAGGSGETVLLLPGLGTDVSAFARQTPVLLERFRLLGVNPRGVGHSDGPEEAAYPVEQTASDAAATYEGAAHVIGASLGAAAALELALRFPDRVKSLTLITPFVESNPRLLAVAEAWQRLAAEATGETLAAALLPWFFSPGFLADTSVRARTLRGLAQTLARVPAPTLSRMVAGLAAWSGTRTQDLSRVAVPTLVISAGDDLLTPGAGTLATEIPGASHVEVAGAGHAVALEAPEAVNGAILKHLS
ncbi:MAG: alpha/beta fold hydrolase [Myxococcales bacterium]|nr:alpha/beta fold hydrolase [Myxococcales bacterium]